MGIPADKTTRSKRGMRRAHHAIKAPAIATCSQCNAIVRPHRVCKECGHYKNKEILAPKN